MEEKENASFNKNEKQMHFNQVKGIISELNDGERFCSLTLDVGHENVRQVNLVMKKPQFDVIKKSFALKDKVCVRYYITSRNKNSRWYTMANVLEVNKENN